mmetsp:Transcript_16049/g.38313  ORF Transcript_16049/g.38313 Transcript_16049/m.38313 type:complete len:203 (+) Transcript_16049:297-905(+)
MSRPAMDACHTCASIGERDTDKREGRFASIRQPIHPSTHPPMTRKKRHHPPHHSSTHTSSLWCRLGARQQYGQAITHGSLILSALLLPLLVFFLLHFGAVQEGDELGCQLVGATQLRQALLLLLGRPLVSYHVQRGRDIPAVAVPSGQFEIPGYVEARCSALDDRPAAHVPLLVKVIQVTQHTRLAACSDGLDLVTIAGAHL